MKKKIILKRIFHRNKWRILISFRYDVILAGLIRQVNGCSYSQTYSGWYADDSEEILKQILHVFRDEADIDISALTKKTEKEMTGAETPKAEVSATAPDSHDSLIDIRYIQALLGHKSTRTTEIYTHVSRRNLVVIRSPIEDMDVK